MKLQHRYAVLRHLTTRDLIDHIGHELEIRVNGNNEGIELICGVGDKSCGALMAVVPEQYVAVTRPCYVCGVDCPCDSTVEEPICSKCWDMGEDRIADENARITQEEQAQADDFVQDNDPIQRDHDAGIHTSDYTPMPGYVCVQCPKGSRYNP